MDESGTAQAWLDRASEDLEGAALLAERLPGLSTFHAQQAAEKALKAVRVKRGLRVEKVHDLDRLARDIKAPIRIAEHASLLTTYYIATRYPEVPASPTRADAQDALTRAQEVVAWCRTQIS